MREYQNRTVTELVASACDRCGRRMSPDVPGEWQERLSIEHLGGFDSVFGDGNTVCIDLCQHCMQELLGPWLRITPLPAGAEFPPLGPAPDAFGLWRDKQLDGLAYQEALRGSALRYDDPTEPVDDAGEEKP